VIGLEYIGNGEHQIKGAAVVAAAGDSGALQRISELEQLEFSKLVALLAGGEGVVLLIRKAAETGRALRLPLEQRADESCDALKEGEQRSLRKVPKGSDNATLTATSATRSD